MFTLKHFITMKCSYNLSSLKPMFWLVDEDKITYNNYEVSLADAERHECLSVEFESESELQGCYQFTKRITIALNGYQPDLVLDGKRIALETVSGEIYLVNWEFEHLPQYTYRLNNEGDTTTYTLECPENLPVFACGEFSESAALVPSAECSYTKSGAKTLKLVERNKCFYGSLAIELLGTEPIEFDGLRDFAFNETYDGEKYEQTISFTLPLDAVDNEVVYRLQEFPDNRWLAVIMPNGIIAGLEIGMEVSTVLRSTDDEASITVNLTSDENINCHQNPDIRFTRNTQVSWKYVMRSTDGNHYGWVCEGNAPNPDGNAMYILQEAFYKNGQSAHRYRLHRDYRNWYPDLNVEGYFTQYVYFYKDSCYAPDTLTVDGIVSPQVFVVVGQGRNVEIKSRFSGWVARSIPSFCTLSEVSGGSGTTTARLTCTGSTNQQGTLLIANDSQAQSFTIIADFSDPVIVPSPETDYSAKTNTYFLRKPVYLQSKSSTSGFDAAVNITGKYVKITFPENQTGQDVTYTFVFATTSYPHVQQTVVITQHPYV